MVVVKPAVIPVVVMIPSMIVFDVAAISVPVTCIKLLTIVARSHPSSTFVRRPRPIPAMPYVAMSDWIPVTVYPPVTRARTGRLNANNARTRRRPNSNSNSNLSLRCRCAGQQHDSKQQRRANAGPNEILDCVRFSFTTHIAQMAPPTG